MKLSKWILAAAFAVVNFNLYAADNELKNWTREQLESKVRQLHQETKDLKAELAKLKPAEAPQAGSSTEIQTAPDKEIWLIDDFDSAGMVGSNGQEWIIVKDEHGLGSEIKGEKVEGKNGKALKVSGFLPENKEPWPWVVAEIPFVDRSAPVDLTGYKTLEFWVKGDGKSHIVRFHRMSVTDWGFPFMTFATSDKWTKVVLNLADFAQPDWAAKVAGGINDAHQVIFTLGGDNTKFEFEIDELMLKK